MKVQVRRLERHYPDKGLPYWTARIVVEGTATSHTTHINVDTQFGSWQTQGPSGRHDVVAELAELCQQKVRPLEKAERKAKEVSEDADAA